MSGSTSSTPIGLPARLPAEVQTAGEADLEVLAASQPIAADAPVGGARWRRLRLPQSFDPLWLAGCALVLLLWWLLSVAMPSALFPGPDTVARRIVQDFFAAPELAFYGLPDASLFNSMLYTAENVALAMVIGTAIGTLSGLLAARFALMRAVLEPIVMTAGT